MKIIYHHRTQLDDAQGIHIREMIKAFAELGHEVITYGLVKKEIDSEKKEIGKHWEAITRFIPPILYEIMEIMYNLWGYHKLRRLVKENRPDFIYERYALNNFCGILAARHSGIPVILEVNAPLYLEKSLYAKLYLKSISKRLETWICNNASKTIVVTSPLKKILTEQGVNPDNLVVMANGINPRKFNSLIDGNEIRKQIGFADNEIVIGIVGWFREWHGLDFLIKTSIEKNIFHEKNARILLSGDGPAINGIKNLINRYHLENYVLISGTIAREVVAQYIAAMDITIQPRVTKYACPMKIVEYLAMGKAIIAPDQPNIRDLLKHEWNALLFEPENKNDLYSKIERLIEDKSLRDRLAKNAIQTIHDKKLLWIENAKRVENIILKQMN